MSKMYVDAGKVVHEILNGASLKKEIASVKPTVALLAQQSLKYIFILEEMFKSLNLRKSLQLDDKNMFITVVMVYDFCFGQGKISGSGLNKRKILKIKNSLLSWIARKKINVGVVNTTDLLPKDIQNLDHQMVYARVNLSEKSKFSEIEKKIFSFGGIRDKMSPSLFMFTKKQISNLTRNSTLIKENEIFIQDKSSCLPVFFLQDNTKNLLSGDIIDACASPGNKTLQLAEVSPHKIFAFELNHKRFSVLCHRLRKFKLTVFPQNLNFLHVDPLHSLYKNVKTILLDPSCSGSGLVLKSVDHWIRFHRKPPSVYYKQLKLYANNQKNLICHAMKFESVETIIYSTCSVERTENEEVVTDILRTHKNFELDSCLPLWPRRGDSTFDQAEKMVRVDPSRDDSVGFFIASFRRTNTHFKCSCSAPKTNILDELSKLERSNRKMFA